MSLRRKDVKDEASQTCAWLVKHKSYMTWLHRNRGLLWIKGKPGAGKSTLLKYALRRSRDAASRNNLVVASFFFHGRGTFIQKSPLGMYRSLLHQTLDQIPELLSEFTSIFKKRCEAEGKPGQQWEWHVMDLRKFLEDSIPHASKSYSIRIYIDALDECGEEVAKGLVADFESLVSRLPPFTETALSICFSCRHYPILALEHNLAICVEDENYQDIRIYVHDQLERGIPDESEARELGTKITDKASGVFQWVCLVVPMVLKLHQAGINMKAIQTRLQHIPSELSSLYEEILENIASEDRPQSLQLMQWICFALRPLSLGELRFAMAVDADTPYDSLGKMRQDSLHYVETDGKMKKRVQSLSGGLAEVRQVKYKRVVVQFIHQSVNDYLIQTGLKKLDTSPEHSVIGRAHFRLSRSCVRYISMEEVLLYDFGDENDPRKKFLFLDYAARYWVSHAEIVEAEGITQGDLLRLFRWPSTQIIECWRQTERDLVAVLWGPQYAIRNVTLLHVASTYGFLTVVAAIIKSEGNNGTERKDAYGQTPLSTAAENGHKAIVELLLQQENVDINSIDRFSQTPLTFAAKHGYEGIVKLLLEQQGIMADSYDEDGRTPLCEVGSNGHEAVVNLLVERHDVEADSKDKNGRMSLSWAAKNGHKAGVQLLMERQDVRADSQDKNNRTPLSYAAGRGSKETVELLLSRQDVRTDSQDKNNRTPLSYAAGRGSKETVELLLSRQDVRADSQDIHGRTPLSYAAGWGSKETVELLLSQQDVKADFQDVHGRTPLSYTAERGSKETVELLLSQQDVRADFQDVHGRTPLSYTAERGSKETVKLLLSRQDVRADSQDIHDRTPLSYAARWDRKEIVKLLLSRQDVRADSQDIHGRTPLSYTAERGSKETVELLLSRQDVRADSQDVHGRTPLSYAAGWGSKETVELLLSRQDVRADFQDVHGRTPLSYTAERGSKETVKLLLSRQDVNLQSKDSDGHTPLWWAKTRVDDNVVKLLEAHTLV
jgi:ankyrin repeat protein